ncbi:hypothetical protein HPULCUR_008818 [Helicostylum pulchrum]|uniref:Uncharacterized protein n=1 Tax=Helicostylum pulchrum TaxID=562976 RepID=A0ABP9Y8P6_9FUNG
MDPVIVSTWHNRVAQYLIWVMYYEGDRGVTMDEESGFQWFILAANNGCSDAMTSTAKYCIGVEIVGDTLKTVVAWLEKMANKDDFYAKIINNGTLYLFGNKDFELSTTHVKPKIISILNLREEYRLISPIQYIEQECDPRMPDSK